MTISIRFLGAAGTVTGSKYLVTSSAPDRKTIRILVDAGIFQGDREWRERNWDKLDEQLLREIDACLLTHAHIDHTGFLPRLVKFGLKCPVYCTAPTAELTNLLLLDSAHLQMEDAEFRAKRGRSRHDPPLPLYTLQDAQAALKLLRPIAVDSEREILNGVRATWTHMGHIIGASSIRLRIGDQQINFSGDVGRYGVPIMRDPQAVELGDLLLIESTYGDRVHAASDPKAELALVINRTYERSGVVLIPSFAVGRTQQLLYYIRELKAERAIPDLPVVIDSPTSKDATTIYARFPEDYDEDALKIRAEKRQPFSFSKLSFTSSKADSIRLNSVKEPMIIISASGMLSGGRILHHLAQRISDERNTLLIVGFQPRGGRGAWLLDRHETVRIFNEDHPVRAEIAELSACSAHADRDELLRWLKSCSGKPGRVCVVHGEPETAQSFADTLRSTFNYSTQVPKYQEELQI